MSLDIEQAPNYGTIPADEIIIEDLDLLQSSKPGYGTRSIFEVSLNIVNATVGSGVIGLPFALFLSGFTLGITISIFVGLLTFAAVYSLILTGQKSQIFNFASLAEVAMGRFGYHMLNFMLFIQSAGSVISYFIRKLRPSYSYLCTYLFTQLLRIPYPSCWVFISLDTHCWLIGLLLQQ